MALVKTVFPIREKQWLMVHLASEDWDFKTFGPAELLLDDVTVRVRYIGWGNVEGIPVLTVTPTDGRYGSVEAVAAIISEVPPRSIVIRRIPD